MTTANQARNRAHYAERLAAALGDGSRWEYRGECCELARADGKCACGHHGLKYLFTLHNRDDGRKTDVGSVCVFSYSSITPDTLAALRADADRLEAAAAERVRAAKEHAKLSEIRDALAEWSGLEYAIDAAVEHWRDAHPGRTWAPYHVYRRYGAAARLADRQETHPHVKAPELKLAAAILRRIRNRITYAAHVLDEIRAYD